MILAIGDLTLSSLHSISQEISNRLSVCRKDVRSELGRLEKQFSRSYTLLQLHQQGLTEQLCSAAIDAITPLKNMVNQSDEFVMTSFIVHLNGL